MNNIICQLQTFFVQLNGKEVSPLTPLHRHLDSMAMLDFIVFIEQEFEISVDDSDVHPKNFSSLEKVATYIATRSSS